MRQRISVMSAGLWWGSLTAIGFVAVPLLFMNLATPTMAGNMAARLFTAQSWMSMACALVLLLALTRRPDEEDASSPARTPMGLLLLILTGLLLALLIEYAVAPRIVARQNLALWHRLGSGMYLLQWLCAGITLWRLGRRS